MRPNNSANYLLVLRVPISNLRGAHTCICQLQFTCIQEQENVNSLLRLSDWMEEMLWVRLACCLLSLVSFFYVIIYKMATAIQMIVQTASISGQSQYLGVSHNKMCKIIRLQLQHSPLPFPPAVLHTPQLQMANGPWSPSWPCEFSFCAGRCEVQSHMAVSALRWGWGAILWHVSCLSE